MSRRFFSLAVVSPMVVVLGVILAGCGSSATPSFTPGATTPPTNHVVKHELPPKPDTIASVPISQLDVGALPEGGGQVTVTSISCPSFENCTAVGTYSPESHSYTNGFIATETRGKWNQAFSVPNLQNLDVGGDSGVNWVSCKRVGYCSAGGFYDDDSQAILVSFHLNIFVVNEVHGTWDRSIPVPGFRKLNQGDFATLDVATCVSVGNCQVLGEYMDNNSTDQRFSDREVEGVWQLAKALGPLGQDFVGGDPTFTSITCATVMSCTATGTWANGGSFAAVMTNAGWRITRNGP